MESDPPESLRMPTIVEDPFHLKSIIDDVIKVSSDPETLSSVPFRIDHRRCDLGPSLSIRSVGSKIVLRDLLRLKSIRDDVIKMRVRSWV